MSESTIPCPDLAALRADLAALQRDVGALVSHLQSDATTTMQGAAAKLEEGAGKLLRNITDEGGRSMKAVGQKIEDQPLLALLIAFGVGYLGGRTIGR